MKNKTNKKNKSEEKIITNKTILPSKYRFFDWQFLATIVICKPAFALLNKIPFKGRTLTKIVCEPCFVDYQSTGIGILRNKASNKQGQFSRTGQISCVICKPAFALSNKTIFQARALINKSWRELFCRLTIDTYLTNGKCHSVYY